MGKTISIVLQMFLFLLLFGAGSFLPVFTSFPSWQVQAGPNRLFVLDGLLLMGLVYLLILAAEAARKQLRGPGKFTTLAFVLALLLGLLMKFGFKSA